MLKDIREPMVSNVELAPLKSKSTSVVVPLTESQQIDKDLLALPKRMEKQMRNIDLYLEDISTYCSLKSFYEVVDIYQRSPFCTVTGCSLKILSDELRDIY